MTLVERTRRHLEVCSDAGCRLLHSEAATRIEELERHRDSLYEDLNDARRLFAESHARIAALEDALRRLVGCHGCDGSECALQPTAYTDADRDRLLRDAAAYVQKVKTALQDGGPLYDALDILTGWTKPHTDAEKIQGAITALNELVGLIAPQSSTEPTATERLEWSLHPRRSESPYGVAIDDPFVEGDRPGLGSKPDRQGK